MSTAAFQVLIGALIAVAVGLLTAEGWLGFVMGAVLAVSLWVMLFFGAQGRPDRQVAAPTTAAYLGTAVVAVGLGFLFYKIGDGPTWWAVGFIMAGLVFPWGSAARIGASDER